MCRGIERISALLRLFNRPMHRDPACLDATGLSRWVCRRARVGSQPTGTISAVAAGQYQGREELPGAIGTGKAGALHCECPSTCQGTLLSNEGEPTGSPAPINADVCRSS